MKLLRESKTITYLENQSTTVYLEKPTGPQTYFKIFGSPSTPGPGNWAFEYQPQEAGKLWSEIPEDADVVVTHTPPKGHCDTATKDDRSGCPALLRRLAEVRPLLHVCGHIHEARGVERVHWGPSLSDSPVDGVERWQDPGRGNKKLSLLDLTSKARRPLGNSVLATRQTKPCSLQCGLGGQKVPQPGHDNLNSTSSHSRTKDALQESEAPGRIVDSGVVEQMRGVVVPRAALQGDSGCQSRSPLRYEDRIETAVINAAYLGPRNNGKPGPTNKPIVVDVDLPVWNIDDYGNV